MPVVSLEQARLDRTPHQTGPAVCIGCKHEWVAVERITDKPDNLQCPECKTWKGVFQGLCPLTGEVFVCACGNDHFMIAREGAHCIGCGSLHQPWDDAG